MKINFKHYVIHAQRDGRCTVTNTRTHRTWLYTTWHGVLTAVRASPDEARRLTKRAGTLLFPPARR